MRHAARSVIGRRTVNIVFEGDSRTRGAVGYGPYTTLVGAALANVGIVTYYNLGISGDKVTQMITEAPSDVDPLIRNGALNIVTILGGVNDWFQDHVDGATIATRLTTYCQARKSAGWNLVGIATELPCNAAGWETDRTTINNAIYSGYQSMGADFIIDLAVQPVIGTAAAANDVTLYPDGLHPTDLGYSYIAPVFAAAIRARL